MGMGLPLFGGLAGGLLLGDMSACLPFTTQGNLMRTIVGGGFGGGGFGGGMGGGCGGGGFGGG